MKRSVMGAVAKRAFLLKLAGASPFWKEGEWASPEMRLVFAIFGAALDDYLNGLRGARALGETDFFSAAEYLATGGVLDVLGIDIGYARRVWTEMAAATQPKLAA